MIGCLWTRVPKQPIIVTYFEFETVPLSHFISLVGTWLNISNFAFMMHIKWKGIKRKLLRKQNPCTISHTWIMLVQTFNLKMVMLHKIPLVDPFQESRHIDVTYWIVMTMCVACVAVSNWNILPCLYMAGMFCHCCRHIIYFVILVQNRWHKLGTWKVDTLHIELSRMKCL